MAAICNLQCTCRPVTVLLSQFHYPASHSRNFYAILSAFLITKFYSSNPQTYPRYWTVSLTAFRHDSLQMCASLPKECQCSQNCQWPTCSRGTSGSVCSKPIGPPRGHKISMFQTDGSKVFFPIEPQLRMCGDLPPAALCILVLVAKLDGS